MSRSLQSEATDRAGENSLSKSGRSERFYIVKCARPLFKKWQVVKRIKNILFFLIASGMTGNEVCFIKDVNMEWIRLEDDFPSGTVHRNGVAVGFIFSLYALPA